VGDRLVVVGPSDRVDHLPLVVLVGAFDLGDKAHQNAVAHDLRLESGGSVGVPDRLTAVRQNNSYAELADPGPLDVGGCATLTQSIYDPSRPVLIHGTKIARGPDVRIASFTGDPEVASTDA
jgi:hypothetical protein